MGRAWCVFPFIQSSKNPIIRFMFWLWPVARIKQETHDRFQPWVLVKTWFFQQAPTASLATTTTTLTTCRTFFNITGSVYRSYRPGQDLFLANFDSFFALDHQNRQTAELTNGLAPMEKPRNNSAAG